MILSRNTEAGHAMVISNNNKFAYIFITEETIHILPLDHDLVIKVTYLSSMESLSVNFFFAQWDTSFK